MVYNILSGEGFDKSVLGSWSMALFVIPILFFVVVFLGRFFEDQFHKGWGFVGAFVLYLVIVTITGSPAWSMMAGLGGAFGGGFLLGNLFGGDDYSGY